MAIKEVIESRNPWKDLAIVAGLLALLFVLWVLKGGSENNSDKTFLTNKDKQAVNNFSVYKDKVFLSAGGAKESDPAKEYVGISYSASEGKKINATGWIFSGWFNEEERFINVIVPMATEIFLSGNVSEMKEIILSPGDRIVLATGKSPVGVGFRLNKCSGYLSQFQFFSPELPKLCPLPKEEKWSASLSENCRAFLGTVPRCVTPLDFPYYADEECRKELSDNLSYNACVGEHKGDKDFYLPEWRIYFGAEELWNDAGGEIILRDNEGKVIDTLAY